MKKAVPNKKPRQSTKTAKNASDLPQPVEPKENEFVDDSACYRSYSDAEKTQALEAVNLYQGNVHAVAKKLDIPYRTLLGWSKGVGVTDQTFASFKNREGAGITELLRAGQRQLARAIFDDDKITQASMKDLATALGIVTDKLLLMDGKPTAINENRDANSAAFQSLVDRTRERYGMSEDQAREWVLTNIPSAKELVM